MYYSHHHKKTDYEFHTNILNRLLMFERAEESSEDEKARIKASFLKYLSTFLSELSHDFVLRDIVTNFVAENRVYGLSQSWLEFSQQHGLALVIPQTNTNTRNVEKKPQL